MTEQPAIEIVELSSADVEASADELAQLLLDAHAKGMALGLAAPLDRERAAAAWRTTAALARPARSRAARCARRRRIGRRGADRARVGGERRAPRRDRAARRPCRDARARRRRVPSSRLQSSVRERSASRCSGSRHTPTPTPIGSTNVSAGRAWARCRATPRGPTGPLSTTPSSISSSEPVASQP